MAPGLEGDDAETLAGEFGRQRRPSGSGSDDDDVDRLVVGEGAHGFEVHAASPVAIVPPTPDGSQSSRRPSRSST